MPVAGAVIGAVGSIGGALIGGSAASGAASDAAQAQAQANAAAIAEQQRQYNLTRGDLAPYRDAGSAALAQQMALLGLGGAPASTQTTTPTLQPIQGPGGNGPLPPGYMTDGIPDGRNMLIPIPAGMPGSLLTPQSTVTTPGVSATQAQQQAIDNLKASPLYQSLFNNGRDTLLANASATGGLRGGNTQGALANFGRDTLSQVIEQQLQDLSGVSGLGENAAAQTGNFGANSANNIAQLLSDTGAAQAGGALASGGASAALANTIGAQIGSLGGVLFPQRSTPTQLAPDVALTIANNPSIF